MALTGQELDAMTARLLRTVDRKLRRHNRRIIAALGFLILGWLAMHPDDPILTGIGTFLSVLFGLPT